MTAPVMHTDGQARSIRWNEQPWDAANALPQGKLQNPEAVTNFVLTVINNNPEKKLFVFDHDVKSTDCWSTLHDSLKKQGFQSLGVRDQFNVPTIIAKMGDYCEPALWYGSQRKFFVWK